MGEGRGFHKVLVGRPEGKRPLERPRHMLGDNIKMDLREIGIDGTKWIRLAQVKVQWWAFVKTVMKIGFHKESRLLFEKLSDYQLFKEYPAPWRK
jgi:hypothetical protein